MKNFVHSIKLLLPYTRPNSFISYLDNIFACIIFFLLKNIKSLTPNKLTFISLVLWIIALIGVLVFGSKVSFVIFGLLSYTFDNIDGIWARYFDQTSKFGAWFDATCDRIKDLLILSSFVFLFHSSTQLFLLCLASLILFGLTIIVESHLEKYFQRRVNNSSLSEKSKKTRIFAFGPAEALILYSLILILPLPYKIVPILIFSLFMIFVLFQIKRSYEFFEHN